MLLDAECFIHVSANLHASIEIGVSVHNFFFCFTSSTAREISPKFLESELVHLRVISCFLHHWRLLHTLSVDIKVGDHRVNQFFGV
jgi:hypothetical protein